MNISEKLETIDCRKDDKARRTSLALKKSIGKHA